MQTHPTSSRRFLTLFILGSAAELYLGFQAREAGFDTRKWGLALIIAIFLLATASFRWVLSAPDNQSLAGKGHRLGREGTRRFAITFGGLCLLMSLPTLYSGDHPQAPWLLLIPFIGPMAGLLLWRGANASNPGRHHSALPSQANGHSASGKPRSRPPIALDAERLVRAKPWILLIATLLFAAFVIPFTSTGLRLVEDGQTFGWLFVVLPVVFVSLALITANRRFDHFIALVRRGKLQAPRKPDIPVTTPSRQTARVSRRTRRGSGITRLTIFALIGALVIWQPWKRESLPDLVMRLFKTAPDQAGTNETGTQTAESSRTSRVESYQTFSNQVENTPSPCANLLAMEYTLVQFGEQDQIDQRMKEALLCKIQRTDYQMAKTGRLLDRGQPFPEERFIRALISRLTELRPPPGGLPIQTIPVIAMPPAIDGTITPGEWDGAITLDVPDSHTRILLAAHQDRLYLAADVRDETTSDAWDSLRLILHQHLSPWLDEEYIFVYGRGNVNSGCRISQVKWPHPPPPGGFPDAEGWKRYRLNECGLYHQVQGGSTFEDHRVYEVSLDLAETSIPQGHPFPLRLEIETAPEYSSDTATGKRRFSHRNYLGPLRPGNPWKIWLMLN